MQPEQFRDMRWRRLDVPGRETARIKAAAAGWRLTGELHSEEDGEATSLCYDVLCDEGWRTRSAEVHGRVGDSVVDLALASDGAGHWQRDGRPAPDLAGAGDVDLSATPSTNTLPIRRLRLKVGEAGAVRAAWLRIPELRVEPLEQTYTRESEDVYRFDALVDGELFSARLRTDACGWVLDYEGLWTAEEADR